MATPSEDRNLWHGRDALETGNESWNNDARGLLLCPSLSKRTAMMLEGEKIPKIHHVTEKHLHAVFDESDVVFGQFVVLSTEHEGFIQSANMWELSEECEEFQDRTRSEPYCLEYKDETTGELFAAEGWFTLEEVKDAFLEYLKGSGRWKKRKVWKKIEY